MLEAGHLISNTYQVLEPIGEGGAGQVYLAWHKNLQKNVVIKRIKDDYVGRINERGEADILKRLHHRYLPQVYDFIQLDREVYTVIDYIDGNTLMDYIDAGVRFEEVQIVKWLKQLTEALDYLHSQTPPIIHSDIKPSNIMIGTTGDICLIDFNISFDETDMKKISGYTAGYASPEQVRKVQLYTSGGNYIDVKLDARSDIFSLGASIYHIMTLQNPVKVLSENDRLWNVESSLPYSQLLLDIITKSLKMNPEERYQTAGEMLRDIETIRIRDKRYRRLNRHQAIYNIIFFILIGIGGLLTAKGTVLRNAEAFDTEYAGIIAEADNGDNEAIINDAIDLLNNKKYKAIFENRQREKADLLFLIANKYFEDYDYENAISFYEKVIKCDDTNPEYFRDYAIAKARSGKLKEAGDILEKGMSKGLKGADLYLVNGEIENANEEWGKAIDEFKKAIDTATNDNIRGRAYNLCAKAYRSNGDLVSARDTLVEAYPVVDDVWRLRVLREEGAVCIQYIEENGEEADSEWIDKAEGCYETLTNSERSTLNDWLNYALIKEIKGDLAGAELIMDTIKEDYPDEYRIPLRQAMFEIEKQTAVDESVRSYNKAKDYYIEAEGLYEKYRNAGKSDNEMQYLESIIQDLYDKGWLEE